MSLEVFQNYANCLNSFTKDEVRRIIPFCAFDTLTLRYRLRATYEEMLCVVLYKLAFPVRLATICDVFGRSCTWISVVFNDVVLHLYNRWQARLHWNPDWLTYERIRGFAEAINRQEGGDIYWGYIDGTARRICRPEEHQRL